uniref:Uncharacterized protein n=1 Tax=Panagrolaimus sp. JU765 TaxID=591449 RepID=A0AC34Q4F9_9BILA
MWFLSLNLVQILALITAEKLLFVGFTLETRQDGSYRVRIKSGIFNPDGRLKLIYESSVPVWGVSDGGKITAHAINVVVDGRHYRPMLCYQEDVTGHYRVRCGFFTTGHEFIWGVEGTITAHAVNVVVDGRHYRPMLCYQEDVTGHYRVRCGFFTTGHEFTSAETYDKCLVSKFDEMAIGRRTAHNQSIYYVSKGTWNRCFFQTSESAQDNVVQDCTYIDYDAIKDTELNCQFKNKKKRKLKVSTFDDRAFYQDNLNYGYFPKKSSESQVLKYHDYDTFDYKFVLDVDDVVVETILPRYFGMKLRTDSDPCIIEFFQVPSDKPISNLRELTCFPKEVKPIYFLKNDTKIGQIFINGCFLDYVTNSLICYIYKEQKLDQPTETVKYYLKDCGAYGDPNEIRIFTDLHRIFVGSLQGGGCMYFFSNQTVLHVDRQDAFAHDPITNQTAHSRCKCEEDCVQYTLIRDQEILKFRNGIYKLLEGKECRTYNLSYDFLFVDDYGESVFVPKRLRSYCFRILVTHVYIVLAVDSVLLFTFLTIFCLEVVGYRKKAWHDIRLELIEQKRVILQAAGRI